MRPKFVHARPIDFANYDFFFVDRTSGNDFAVWSADETLSPEFDTVAASRRFMTHAVRRCDIATVRDCVTALNRFPGVVLRRAEFFFLARMPADRRWIKNNLRAAQRRQPRRFRIPLVPANAHAELAALCVPRLKAEITRREIKFLVIKRIVRNVHLTIFPKKFSVRVDDRGGVVINAGHAFFEK